MSEPTPTVIDIALARKWYRCDWLSPPCPPGHDHRRVEAAMAAEIAVAREAWGVPREAVAGLVEAVENYRNCQVASAFHICPTGSCDYALRAALERVKSKVWAHEVGDLNRPISARPEPGTPNQPDRLLGQSFATCPCPDCSTLRTHSRES